MIASGDLANSGDAPSYRKLAAALAALDCIDEAEAKVAAAAQVLAPPPAKETKPAAKPKK